VIVVDASVLADLVRPSPDASALADALFASGAPVHAPHLLDVEVAHVLRRFTRRGELSASRGGLAMQFLAVLPVTRHDAVSLLPRSWALRDRVSAYDAAYVALAEVLDATLVTRDRRLAAAVHGIIPLRVL